MHFQSVANFTPQSHSHYQVGVPLEGYYGEVFNTDSSRYGGSNLGNLGGKFTNKSAMHGYEQSINLCLPPLSVLVLQRDDARSQALCDESAEAGQLVG